MEYVSATCASRSTLCGLFLLDRKLAWEDCGGAAAAAAAGAPGAHQRNEKSYIYQMNCVLSLQNAQTNTQNNTGLD